MSRFLTKSIVTLMLTICITISLQAQWTSFKLPGGVHHKTVFIDHAEVQAMASVCMSNYLCVKEWNGSGWEDWEEVEASFYSTWGVDWAVIDNLAYIVVGGQEMRVLKYVTGSWAEEDMGQTFEKPSFFRVEACVFYADSNGLEYDNVLVHLTETADDNNYGLRWWNENSWDYVDDPDETQYYGFRMWRALEDPQVVYMTGHVSPNDPNKIYSINVNSAISSGFDPEEIINSSNTSGSHGVYSVSEVPTFYQWDDDGVYYQYVAAHTRDNSALDYYDIWVREYDAGWSNWSILIKGFGDSDQLPGLVDGSGNLGAVQIAARPYADGETIEHRVYIASDQYGLIGYDSELFVPSVVNPAFK